jgi:hypothetical protein
MNNALLSFVLSAVVVSNVPAADQAEGDIERPNIILLMGDDQGWEETGTNSSFTTERVATRTWNSSTSAPTRPKRTNPAESEPAIVKTMQIELRTWQQSVLRSLTGADYGK